MHQALLDTLPPDEVDVVIQRAEEAEVDEMWSYVGKKKHRDGSGMRLITAVVKSWRTSLGAAKMQCF